MGCCGQRRIQATDTYTKPSSIRPSVVQPAAPTDTTVPVPQGQHRYSQASVAILYLENSTVLVHGSATGREYRFSSVEPVQAVDARDAAALIRTRFFKLA